MPTGAPGMPDFVLNGATGEIDGKMAVAVYPAVFKNQALEELLVPFGFEAHFTELGDPETELVFPCGEWFLPPRGKWRVWVEGYDQMSPYSGLLLYADDPFNGRGLSVPIPVTDVGRVTLPSGQPVSGSLELRLLRAEDHLSGHLVRWELSRRKPAGEVGDGLQMPVGQAIGGLFDRGRQRYVALSRPFRVEAGETVEVPLERPERAADVVVQVRRPRATLTVEDDDYELRLEVVRGAETVPPDATVATATTAYGVWYDLAPGPAELRGGTWNHAIEPQRLELTAGAIEQRVAKLEPRPALDVELALPAELEREPSSLELRLLPVGEVVARRSLVPGSRQQRFERLPPGAIEVGLETPLGTFHRRVELAPGEEGYLLLEPALVEVRGTVTRGGEGQAASLTFTTIARTAVEAVADGEGEYEAVALEPLRSVEVRVDGVEGPPYLEFFPVAVERDDHLDFRLSAGFHRTRVVDAATGLPVPGAAVSIRNLYTPPAEEAEPARAREESEREQRMTVAQSAVTDDTGMARLPPLRPGQLELRAAAEGYRPMREPLAVTLDEADTDTDRDFELALEPLGETVELTLVLPGGAPAAGAEVMVVDPAGTSRATARADGRGVTRVPREPAGVLLARHPGAAFLARDWRPAPGETELRWELPPTASQPLSIRVRDPGGEVAAPRAELALWVGGVRLSGGLLAWLTLAPPAADGQGLWIGRNLPPVPVGVLAWERRLHAEAAAGGLDAQAVEIGYPWPDPVEIRVLR